MTSVEMSFYFYSACCLLIIFSKASTAIDTISPSESFTDGMTLVSDNGSFVLGFFTLGSSKNRYLGIWYNDIRMQTVVWVANRINPINDSTGLLKIEGSGKIVLQVQNRTAVWSTNSTANNVQNPILQLLDNGNLVVKDGKDDNPENYLWQSFDYPTDTMLPGMIIGIDLRTGLHQKLRCFHQLRTQSILPIAFIDSSNGSYAAIVAAVAGALASTVNTFEHGCQVGMLFEMYRNNAGFFKLVQESIESTLNESDLEKRENGEVFEMNWWRCNGEEA